KLLSNVGHSEKIVTLLGPHNFCYHFLASSSQVALLQHSPLSTQPYPDRAFTPSTAISCRALSPQRPSCRHSPLTAILIAGQSPLRFRRTSAAIFAAVTPLSAIPAGHPLSGYSAEFLSHGVLQEQYLTTFCMSSQQYAS
ncbi:hypothetical protein AVEN_111893-1, partial [Araneus ventricosus]